MSIGGFINTKYSFSGVNYTDNAGNQDINVEEIKNNINQLKLEIEKIYKQRNKDKDKDKYINLFNDKLTIIVNKINEIGKIQELKTNKKYDVADLLNTIKKYKKSYDIGIINKFFETCANKLDNILENFTLYKNINCYISSDKKEDCINFPFHPFDESKTDKQKKKYIENSYDYIDNTFGLLIYPEIFEIFKINSYLILKSELINSTKCSEINDSTYYEIDSKNIILVGENISPETKIFILCKDMSLYQLPPEKYKDVIDYIEYNTFKPDGRQIYYNNTENTQYCDVIRASKMGTQITDTINKIKQYIKDPLLVHNTYTPDNPNTEFIITEFKNIISEIDLLLEILYIYDTTNNKYMSDVLKYKENFIIYLLYINKIDVLFDILNKVNTLDTKSDLFIQDLIEDLKTKINIEDIKYSYNLHIYISETKQNVTPKNGHEIIPKINKFLKMKEEELYQLFLEEFIKIINICLEIEKKFNKLSIDIITNFMLKYFNNQKNFIVSKNQILSKLLIKDTSMYTNKYTMPIDKDKIIFNYIESYHGKYEILNRYIDAEYKGIKYPDCGEITIFNIFNYLLTHNNKTYNKKFMLDKLPEESEIKKYYNKHETYEKLYNEYIKQKKNKINFGNEFYTLFTEKLGIEYNKQTCDIKPNINNILKICNILMLRNDANKFNTLEEFVKHFDENNICIKIDENTYTINTDFKINVGAHSSIMYKSNFSDELGFFVNDQHQFCILLLNENTEYYKNPDHTTLLNKEDLSSINNYHKLLLYSNNYNIYLYLFMYSYKYNSDIDNLINLLCNKYKLGINSFSDTNSTILHGFAQCYQNKILTDKMIDFIDFLLKEINIDKPDSEGYTPLILANTSVMMNLLIVKGANVNISNIDGDTPLMFAIDKEDFNMVKLLIDNHANVNIADIGGNTPLLMAFIKNNREIIKLLIDNGANVNIADIDGNTPLITAIGKEYFNIVELMIDKNANVNIANANGTTPLLLAVYNNNIEIIKLLIHKGAHVNIATTDGNTPLFVAVNNNNIETIKLLIDKGAHVNIADINGNTPLLLAVINNNIEILKLLIDKGAHVNIANTHGDTPLLMAVINNNIEILKLLIDKGPHVNIANINGDTPLLMAVNRNNTEIIKLLIDKNADVNITNINGDTPLLFAVINNNIEILKLLINKGANVNITNINGDTPLLFAVIKNNREIIKLLINKGANVNITNINGDTPLTVAVKQNKIEIVNLIIDKVTNKLDFEKALPLSISNINLYRLLIQKLNNLSLLQAGYKNKYIKYKQKYIFLKNNIFSG